MRPLLLKCLTWGTGITAVYDCLSRCFPYSTFFRLLLRPLIFPGVWMFPYEGWLHCTEPQLGNHLFLQHNRVRLVVAFAALDGEPFSRR